MSAADEKKGLGNTAFAAKNYDEAIKYYTEAIVLDKKNHVYFSNRSASYAGKKKWESAAIDAKECIKLNPSFIKGYYRLATAQVELGELDGAIATLKQGLNLDADNDQLSRLFRIAKAKKASVSKKSSSLSSSSSSSLLPSSGNQQGNVDSSLAKEIYDLQDQLRSTAREYNIVNANISKAEKEKKMNDITKMELEKLPKRSECKVYRGIGKMFMLSSQNDINDYLDQSIQDDEKKVKDLTQKREYLERRMKSQQQNIIELTKTPSAE
mmetsp:Transcript_3197/g.3053  ORF Transcript_3197/g.3053 Transcript_3197/m.3053 type:complete len:268 (-) Transcript_3197:64-867(-)|eukprot:CAMPEP_0197833594 /NCGR_PEP_ID=MMETSP1437-20131217/19472_1 /TAXON_ID=49252 ORGANISM="Eucampia antarctica, Strain CCMP1452" /NCGR_SAMPLE_ID=MMETSP1437 /ASSEMBLY_ACC=CAM_ASM_001096 /LENGTH=267 /DNA_ID=CAMNT_0043437723 /DNA_START=21 /DNA_END=824 /DNA_ORIENTATION=-